MPRPARRKAVTESQTRQYLAKAEEFLLVAEESLAADRRIAATGNAVHAAISAADAVCGIRIRERHAGQDHAQALDLLRHAGPDGAESAKHLSRVLPLKTKAEYDPTDIAKGTASRAVESARKAVTVARRVMPAP